jgi:hypothetical protein
MVTDENACVLTKIYSANESLQFASQFCVVQENIA